MSKKRITVHFRDMGVTGFYRVRDRYSSGRGATLEKTSSSNDRKSCMAEPDIISTNDCSDVPAVLNIDGDDLKLAKSGQTLSRIAG